MLSLTQICEVFVLRNKITVGEWTQCRVGNDMRVKKESFWTSTEDHNRCCGDMSRVMASFSNNHEATQDYYFGKYAALCGDQTLMYNYLTHHLQYFGWIHTKLFFCVEGAIKSGDWDCLETCLTLCTACFNSHLRVRGSGPVTFMRLLVFHLLRFCNLRHIAAYTLNWISSKWSKEYILSFIADIPLIDKQFEQVYTQIRPVCCSTTRPSNASMLLRCFSSQGALAGFQWLHGMGVKSRIAVADGLICGNREIPEHLLSTHSISICDETAFYVLTRCKYETLEWCVKQSLISFSEGLILCVQTTN